MTAWNNTQEALWPFDLYILHVSNIFKGFKHHTVFGELAHYGSEPFIYQCTIPENGHVTKNEFRFCLHLFFCSLDRRPLQK